MPDSYNNDVYRILMDERWVLEDLYTLPHAYAQNFAFVYCFDTPLEARDAKRIDFALQGYPWKGGYSYVNIYTVLKNQIPPIERPQIVSIQYASPGWLDLLLNPDVALKVAKSIGILLGAGVTAAATYKQINKIFISINKQRRKAKIDNLKLSQSETKELNRLSEQLAKSMGFGSVSKLNERTKDPEISARLLSAHYRRMSIMAEFADQGKVKFPDKLKDDG